jgi:hypothetical protein
MGVIKGSCPKTDPGGLWLSLEGQVTLLQMAIPEG